MTGTYKYDMAYWDLPKFHCEMVKPICDEAQRISLEVRFDLFDFSENLKKRFT